MLVELDAPAEGAAFPLNHNPIAFDLPHPAATKPDLRLMRLRRNWFFVSVLCYKLLPERIPWCAVPSDATHGYRAT